jgi:hypothetical protein
MNPTSFDHLVMVLGGRTRRRSLVGLLAAVGSTGLLIRDVAAASCSPDGTRCGGSTGVTCCSGFCKRKRGTHKQFCRQAPSQGICTIERNACVSVSGGDCSAGGTTCKCFITTSGRSFCGELLKTRCTVCTTDGDCTKVTGKGSACGANGPGCCDSTATFCSPPCPTLI